MGRLTDYCIYDSEKQSTCALSAEESGVSLSITVQKDERLLVYDLEAYLGEGPIKRPDRLLIGRVGKGPWVVVLVELKSGTGWGKALEQFRICRMFATFTSSASAGPGSPPSPAC